MKVTFFQGATTQPATAEVRDFATGADFLDWLATVPSRECATEADKKASPAFALCAWRPGSPDRTQGNIAPDASTSVLAFDLDAMSTADIARASAQWQGLDFALYSTFKHRPDAPKLRLLVALDTPLSLTDARAYKAVYRATAKRLGINNDTQTSSPSNLFFLPQHQPGSTPQRGRVRGAPLPLAVLQAHAAAEVPEVDSGPEGVTGARPERSELRKVAEKLRKRQSASHKRAGLALAAILRGEAYARQGHVYGATQDLAFALAFDIPDLDDAWFREQWLGAAWRTMWPGEDLSAIEKDWSNAWRSARERRAEHLADRAAERQALRGDAPAPASDAALEHVRAHASALICVHGTAYYVLDPETGTYTAPVRGGGVAARARDLLAGVPGVQTAEPRENGRPCPKSPTQLVSDYGTAIDEVHYWARPPEGPCYVPDARAIRIAAYRWNTFEPTFHKIVDDLWRSMAGDKYPTLEAWLTKFRALDKAIPALVLVGPKGVWKSKTSQTLSRFWGDPDAPTACRAQQVLGRFSAPLLSNPVVWSDENLAVDERGKEIPERYRESISERTHQIERKGIDPVTLHSALRHVISVNDLDKVFSREVHGDAVEATLDRYLVIDIDGERMRDFEARWAGTVELEALRGSGCVWMLEHVMWLEDHRAVPDMGRFCVETHTDPDVLRRARYRGDVLNLILQVATDALLAEAERSVRGDMSRMPLRLVDGQLRLAPRVVVNMWSEARATRGFRGSTPTIARVTEVLTGAGFRAGDGGPDGFVFDAAEWGHWLRLGETFDVGAVQNALKRVFG